MSRMTRIGLPTGVTLAVELGGKEGAPAIIFLHGFPESHRTWREILPRFARDHYLVAPDQRGFAGSDRPEGVEGYAAEEAVADLFALADALGIEQFTLVGHDWGGAVAWAAAYRAPERISRLVIVNAPHPQIFQASLIEDEAQRAASQYMNAFRNPLMEQGIAAMGLPAFFEKTFGPHVDLSIIPDSERETYLRQWGQEGALTAMLNWYRASPIVVPEPGEKASLPLWARAPFPKLPMPVLVVWGLGDRALLPVQLEGLEDVADRTRIVRVADSGHFLPWEKPGALIDAIRDFFGDSPAGRDGSPRQGIE